MPYNASKMIDQLRATFPGLTFQRGDDFYWSPSEQVVFYLPVASDGDAAILLHETAHALLKHQDFTSDIALLKYENEAWQHAKLVLAPRFGVMLSEESIQDHLDTYRDWLHARSTCPECSETGLQTKTSTYQCINCQCSWMVNDARRCQLRRTVLPVIT